MDEDVVAIHPHAVGIRKDIDRLSDAGRMLADIHTGGYLEYHIPVGLGCVNACRHLGITEHIQHAVVADPVPGAEILMRIVIRHAPAKAAGNIIIGIDRV